ncbi:MAG: ferrous iron transport protein A [Faecousia sp.]
MTGIITLDQLHPRQAATVRQVQTEDSLHQRLADLGLVEGTKVCCRLVAPGGSPAAYEFRGAVVALRQSDARGILCCVEESS